LSQHLQPSLKLHSQQLHSDLLQALFDHARSSTSYEKQILSEIQSVLPSVTGIPEMETGIRYTGEDLIPSPIPQSGTMGRRLSRQQQSPLPSPVSSQPQPQLQPPRSPQTQSSESGYQSTQHRQFAPPATPQSPSSQNQPVVSSNLRPQTTPLTSPSPTQSEHILAQSMITASNTAKRSVNTLARSVSIPKDVKQRVDAKSAARALAGGF